MGRTFSNSKPSKIPAAFRQRVLRRLLPGPSVIASLSKEQLQTLLAKKKELEALVESDPLRFFLPNPGGQRAYLEERRPEKRVLCYFAGNKSGKTTAGAIRCLERLAGRPLWGTETRAFSDRVPARGVCFAEDFDSHREVTIPVIESWAPRGFIKKTSRNPAGHVVEMTFANGSLLHFRTYDQGSEKAEGKDWDFAWCDEPPPRSLYTAIFRGLVVSGGTFFITATLLKETWLFDELEHEFVVGFEGTIHDNVWIDAQSRADFLTSLLEDERVVRETGKPASLVGIIYKTFSPSAPFVVEEGDVPSPYNCPIILCVDPHERKPVYCLWIYITPEDRAVVFDWDLVPSAPLDSLFSRLGERESMHLSHSTLVLMDPNRGRAKQLGGQCWEDVFSEHDYSVVLGNDDINMGHTAVRSLFALPTPQLVFTTNCLGKHGPIYQLQRYSWDDWAHKKIERDVKEKPKDRHKDFPDLLRYFAMAGLSYDALFYGAEVLDRMKDGWRRRELRAYA